ncbi:MAG: helix-turn-helix domain-containing protein [Candidatus Eremiobacteraeota bacterium]|nr:helix-turn-helix domain-containing protein [Candidatus Eremiobacteraeota bacterium]MBV8582594.1 helix-turn-helix domain-containing protein [Candidatus Eremiobacteraeota bacterium]
MTPEAIVEFAEGLARIAASGGGAKALAAHLAETIHTGVLIEDSQWHHLAAAGPGATPPSARHAPDRAQPIMAGTVQVGWLSIGEAHRELAHDAVHLVRLTASAVGVELARNGETGRGRRRIFWERLVGRTYHDTTAARDDAAARGVVIAPAYVAVALEAESEPGGDSAADRAELRAVAAEAFRGGDADVGFFERSAALLVFVPAVREIDASNARTAATLLPKSAAKRAAHLRLSGGIGRVESLLSAYQSVESAEAALAIGRRVFGPGRVVAYDDLGAYPLLYEGADVDRLKRFAEATLAPLRAYDEKHQTELARTLALYFAVGQNVKTAAERLSVHRHTVFYRLRQIGEICGRSLESPHDQLTLRLAVAIDVLHFA